MPKRFGSRSCARTQRSELDLMQIARGKRNKGQTWLAVGRVVNGMGVQNDHGDHTIGRSGKYLQRIEPISDIHILVPTAMYRSPDMGFS